jgi:photosystem II stability/assembly factor-like uncharacterized protein
MRKYLLLIALSIAIHSQFLAQEVPNGGFEDWEITGDNVLEPVYWQTDNMDDLTLVYQEAGHSGQFSAKISVEWDESLGMNLTPILYYEGYFPISERFTSLEFYAMGESLNDDYLSVNVGMYKNGILIGSTFGEIFDDFADWTQVSVPISYGNEELPDECFISITFWPAGSVDLGTYMFIDDLDLSMGSGPLEPVLLAAITNTAGSAFELNFNTPMADPTGTHNQFSGTHNGAAVSFTSAALKSGNDATIVLNLASPVQANEVLKVSYTAGTVTSEAGVALASFTNQDVTNIAGGTSGSWQLIPGGVEENLHSVHFAGSNVGYISGGAGRCLKSVNSGFNWTIQTVPSYAELFTIWATSTDDVHIGAWDTVYNSHNGGQTWTGVYINTVNYYIMDMQFHSANNGFAFMQASAFKKTTDGGNSWSPITGSGVIDDFLAGFMIDETNGFAVGGAGLMCHTTDGGLTWPQYDWNNWTEWSPINIEGVYFTSAVNGYAVADSGILLRTSDGGNHWTKSYIAGPDDKLMDVFFLNAAMGWIVGYHGKIFSTTDGGNTWNQEPVLTSQNLNSVFFISASLGWAVGDYGTILRFGEPSSSVPETGQSSPRDLHLYPNPFSDKATLRIEATEKMDVEVDIFDLAGRKVEQVFNGTLLQGSCEIELALPDLQNGIYFCRVSGSGTHACTSFVINK